MPIEQIIIKELHIKLPSNLSRNLSGFYVRFKSPRKLTLSVNHDSRVKYPKSNVKSITVYPVLGKKERISVK